MEDIKLVCPCMLGVESILAYELKTLGCKNVTVENGIDDTIAPLFDLYKGNRDWVEFQNEEDGHIELTSADISQRFRRKTRDGIEPFPYGPSHIVIRVRRQRHDKVVQGFSQC